MASIYKDKKTGKYKIAYFPRPHVRRIIVGCYDLKGTQAIARKLEDEARQIRRGVIDTKAERLSHSEALPLANHLAAFVAMMQGKGVTEGHVKRTEAFIKGVVEACGFETAGYLDAAKVSAHVADLKAKGKHARAINARLTAIKSFTRWLFRTEQMRTDPMMQVPKLNAKADRQHVRRALTDDELARLIAAAQAGPAWSWRQGNGKEGAEYRLEALTITGPDRAMLCRLAAETGLRADELASLTPTSFLLDDLGKATVKVLAAYSKHRRDDLVPLRRDFAQALATFLEGRPTDAPLFTVPDRTADMLRSDLEAARQTWLKEAGTPQEREEREKTYFCVPVDSSGHVVDFHALRHTFITRLARSGVAPAVAKSLARHSTITLTMDHYTHTLIGDERAALDRLPTMIPAPPDREAAKATGTYDTTGRGPEKGIAPALARSDPGRPFSVIARQRCGPDGRRVRCTQSPVNAGTWQRSPTLANKIGPLAQRLEQGTHNPLVVGSNPTGPSHPSSFTPEAAAAGTINQAARGLASVATRSSIKEAARTPLPSARFTAAGSLSYTTHSCPALVNRGTRFAPIRPRPTIPICMGIPHASPRGERASLTRTMMVTIPTTRNAANIANGPHCGCTGTSESRK